MEVREIEPRILADRVRRALAELPGEAMASTYDQILDEGRIDGTRRLLTDLLEAKFGQVPEKTRRIVADATAADVRRWSVKMQTATKLDEVFAPA